MRFLWPCRFLYFDKLSSHRLGGAKIGNFSLLQGGKEIFFVKMLAGWGNGKGEKNLKNMGNSIRNPYLCDGKKQHQ